MTDNDKIIVWTYRDGDKLVEVTANRDQIHPAPPSIEVPNTWQGLTLHMKRVEFSQEDWLEQWKANGMKVRVGDETVSLTELGYTFDDIEVTE